LTHTVEIYSLTYLLNTVITVAAVNQPESDIWQM